MAEPLRILQLNSARKFVGEAAHTLNLTEALRRRGHLVEMGLREGFDTFNRARARGLNPVGFNMSHRWWPPKDLRDIQAIAKIVKRDGVDIIHAHRGKDHWLAVVANRVFRLRVPIVRTRHVVTPLSGNPANRWLARRTEVLIAVSRAVEEDVRNTKLYQGNRLAFIPGGIDLDLFRVATAQERALARSRLGISDAAPVVACVARFAAVKAHRVLIPAWKSVHANFPDAKLMLIGKGVFLERSKALASELGLADSIQFLGRRDDVHKLLDAADIGCLSSVGSEGFSRAVLEYMAKGLPCVCTRVGATPDLVVEGVTGRLVEADSVNELAAALTETLSLPPEQRAQRGRAGREKAEGEHGYLKWAQAHEEVYRAILRKP